MNIEWHVCLTQYSENLIFDSTVINDYFIRFFCPFFLSLLFLSESLGRPIVNANHGISGTTSVCTGNSGNTPCSATVCKIFHDSVPQPAKSIGVIPLLVFNSIFAPKCSNNLTTSVCPPAVHTVYTQNTIG